jgi:hypothetical protein
MGDVVRLRPETDPKVGQAFMAYVAAFQRAQATGKLRDMAEAVRTYEAWLALYIPDEASRRRVWP